MSHDDDIFSKQEDYIKNPKDQFKRVLKWVTENAGSTTKNYSLIDLGCARGELITYLNNNLKNFNFTGIDSSNKLISLIPSNQPPNVDFHVVPIEDLSLDHKYDFLTMCGVTEMVSRPSALFDKISGSLKKGGKGIIFSMLNQYNVDVLVKYKANEYHKEFQEGLCLHSLDTIENYLSNHNLKIINCEKFFPDNSMEPKADPTRSWMTKLFSGEKKYINGLGQLYDVYFIEFVKC